MHRNAIGEHQVKHQVQLLELAYIIDLFDSVREVWLSAQDALGSSSAERKQVFFKLAFYEEGEKIGHFLAKIFQSHQRSLVTGAIRSCTGCIIIIIPRS